MIISLSVTQEKSDAIAIVVIAIVVIAIVAIAIDAILIVATTHP